MKRRVINWISRMLGIKLVQRLLGIEIRDGQPYAVVVTPDNRGKVDIEAVKRSMNNLSEFEASKLAGYEIRVRIANELGKITTEEAIENLRRVQDLSESMKVRCITHHQNAQDCV